MKKITTTAARENLYRLVDQVAESREPVYLAGRRAGAVLVAADDWSAIQETLYLLAVPGMRESIRKGLATPLDRTFDTPGW